MNAWTETKLTWTVLVDDLLLSLDARPLVALAVVCALALYLGVRLARGRANLSALLALSGAGLGALLGVGGNLRAITATKITSVAAAFPGALLVDGLLACAAGAAGALALTGAARALLEERWVALAGANLALLLAALGFVGALGHAKLLRSIGAIPRVEARGCAPLHVGLSCTPRLEVFAHNRVVYERRFIFFTTGRTFPARMDALERGWDLAPVTFTAGDAPGAGLAFAVAERPHLTVTRALRFQVADERMDPRFAPALGDAWRFTRAQRSQQVLLFFFRSSHNHKVDAELRVTGRAVVDGKRALVLERSGFGAPARFYAAGVDGETLFRPADDDEAGWRPALVRRDITEPLPDDFLERDMKRHLDERVELEGPDVDVFRCDFPMLPASGCDCAEKPMGGPRQKAGPVLCHLPRDGGADFVHGLIAIFTLGLVILDNGAPVYALMSSGPAAPLVEEAR